MDVEQRQSLIDEIKKNRSGHYEILEKIKNYSSKLDVFKIEDKDFRARGRAAEIAKAMTEVIKAELDIRKTIDNSAKLEYELRTKLDQEISSSSDGEKIGDIRDLFNQMEKEFSSLSSKSDIPKKEENEEELVL